MPKLTLSATIEVPDDHRAQSRITTAIEPDIAGLEDAIQKAVGHDVKIVSRIVRDKPKAAPSIPHDDAPAQFATPEGRAPVVRRILTDAGV